MSRLRALSLLVITLSLTLSSAPRLALGSGLFELSGGPSHVLGGALKGAGGGGSRVSSRALRSPAPRLRQTGSR